MNSAFLVRRLTVVLMVLTIIGHSAKLAMAQRIPPSPFQTQIPLGEFPPNVTWINTSGPIKLKDLRGKFVLLDFWTYCCINCMHILPELKKLEEKYPNELVVIGVHTAKFENEKDDQNIREAILRYRIEHPVINDHRYLLWNSFRVSSWPTILLIDPEGNAVYMRGGEFQFEEIDALMQKALAHYRARKLIDTTPVRFELLMESQEPTPLSFPGKVLAVPEIDRLFIADSNHNRIVVSDMNGKLIDIIGSGQYGDQNGSFDKASFKHPQGMVYHNSELYIADTEGHSIRKADLANQRVSTVAGTGQQTRNPWPGYDPRRGRATRKRVWNGNIRTTPLGSPWDLWIHDDTLFIAMAGPHQIWSMKLNSKSIGPYAGNGREDIVDGALMPSAPYAEDASSFAQPSGLTSDGQWLYVADSEGSSIRAVPLNPRQEVRTVVGTSHLPQARLFTFGDQDGSATNARLQHPLGVAYLDGKIYVADTYNNKVRTVAAETGDTGTLVGTGEPGKSDSPAQFDEPGGLSVAAGKLYVADTNNHAIRIIDLNNGNKVSTLSIQGLKPPAAPDRSPEEYFADAVVEEVAGQTVAAADNKIRFQVTLKLPDGYKMNSLAPVRYLVSAGSNQSLFPAALTKTIRKKETATDTFTLEVPARTNGAETIQLMMNYFYCQDGSEGLCRTGGVRWKLALTVDPAASESVVQLSHTVPELVDAGGLEDLRK